MALVFFFPIGRAAIYLATIVGTLMHNRRENRGPRYKGCCGMIPGVQDESTGGSLVRGAFYMETSSVEIRVQGQFCHGWCLYNRLDSNDRFRDNLALFWCIKSLVIMKIASGVTCGESIIWIMGPLSC